MISVREAKHLIKSHIDLLQTRRIHIDEAIGHVLAEDVFAPINIPAFLQSSMDGFAFNHQNDSDSKKWTVSEVIPAGRMDEVVLAEGCAARIFTGARLPLGANVVIKQENTLLEGDIVTILQEDIQAMENIRPIGSEIQAGELAVAKGILITPAIIGFFASLGLEYILVTSKPRICILVTGNELVEVGASLKLGQIYESNAHMLRAALSKLGIHHIDVKMVEDELEAHIMALENALENADLILFSGGVSVGDFDFVARANEACGVEKIFHKVKQKPGKPLFFGKKGDTVVFGLPGNPASVLSCYYNYVTLAIERMSGCPCRPHVALAKLASDYKKPVEMTHFLKGIFYQESVEMLTGQESYKLQSFAQANCLIEIEEGTEWIGHNDWVKVYLINS